MHHTSSPRQKHRLLSRGFQFLALAVFSLTSVLPLWDAGAQGANYRIRANDRLDVDVHEELDLSGEKSVARDGSVKLHLLERAVKVGGLTAEQAARKTSALYANGYLRNPQVTVTVVKLPASVASRLPSATEFVPSPVLISRVVVGLTNATSVPSSRAETLIL